MSTTTNPVTLVNIEHDDARLSLLATPDCLTLVIRGLVTHHPARFDLTRSEAHVLSALLLVAAGAMKKPLDTYPPDSIT